jgi:CRP/FNR family transcriptional regulator, cyclic AMP receptor protein
VQDELEAKDNILVELARHGETRTWEPGSVVIHEGDEADCLYIIHSGELRAVVAGDGDRQVELNTLGPGEFFGELMLSGGRRSATVEVITRAQLTRVSKAALEQVLAAHPQMALQLIHSLVARVRALTGTVRRLASVDVYGRLVGLFDALAVEENGLRVVPGPLSQARIAERLGASRAMVNRLLQDLARGGYIDVTRARIVLLKPLPARW